MIRRNPSVPVTDSASPGGAIRLDQPHDRCFRCGRPTPPGVSLCERDNPGEIKGPSATQVHGTILVGVLAGFVALAILLRVFTAGVGPFISSVAGVATRADGGLDVVVAVTNGGTRTSGASCRISPGGAPDYSDYVFFTEPIPAAETRQFSKALAAPDDGSSLSGAAIVVRCN